MMSLLSLTFDISTIVFPPVLGYFVMAVLAVTPKTHALRVALWPVITSFALRAAVSVDMSPGEFDKKFRNMLFMFSMLFIITRTFDWASVKESLVRNLRPTKSRSTILDAIDLAMTLRGYGWDWAHEVYFPHETRPTERRAFIVHVVLSATFHALLCGILQVAIQSFSPAGFGSLSGGSIFDETLPFYIRHFRASVISVLATVAIYAVIQTYYDTCTLVALLFLGHDPAQWPPAFEAPWCATSMADFWGRRWHQFFRRMFVIQGGYPLSFFLGRSGFIVGTFLSSGILHHVAMTSLNDRAEPLGMLVGFGMMGPVILAERAFKHVTGKNVGGLVGWVWTMSWFLLLGNMIIDAFASGGVFGHFSFTEDVVPGQATVQRLVASFDSWLHTLKR